MTNPAVRGQEITLSDAIEPQGVRVVVWGAGFPPAETVTVHGESLPTPRQRPTFVITGSTLNSDRGEFCEFLETAGSCIGEGAAHTGGDAVEQILDSRRFWVNVHSRRRDALFEQAFACT